MGIKRLVAAFVVITLLTVGTVSPTPAHAISTGEAFIIAGVVIAGWVAFIVIGAALTTRHNKIDWAEAPADLPSNGKHPRKAVRFGTNCRPTATEMTPLVCW